MLGYYYINFFEELIMDSQSLADFQTQVKSAQSAILYFEEKGFVPFSDGSELAKKEAEGIIAQPAFKERACAALQSVSNDLDEITKEATKTLWALVIAGTVIAPQNPILYGWIGVLVYRATVKGFCKEFQKSNKN
jgi:hypothetical protein